MVELPDVVDLPLEAELARLPKSAIVAYAVRNALRVLPLFGQMAFYCDRAQFQVYARELIKVLGLSCAKGGQPALYAVSAKAARDASRAAAYVHAVAASRAAFAVSRAYSAADERIDATRAASFAAAFATTAFAAADSPASADEEASRSMTARAAAKRDYDVLVEFCVDQRLRKIPDAGVDAGEQGPLGSLWPEGPPDWYIDALPKWQAALRDAGLGEAVSVPQI
jgi:hypothetical protein